MPKTCATVCSNRWQEPIRNNSHPLKHGQFNWLAPTVARTVPSYPHNWLPPTVARTVPSYPHQNTCEIVSIHWDRNYQGIRIIKYLHIIYYIISLLYIS